MKCKGQGSQTPTKKKRGFQVLWWNVFMVMFFHFGGATIAINELFVRACVRVFSMCFQWGRERRKEII